MTPEAELKAIDTNLAQTDRVIKRANGQAEALPAVFPLAHISTFRGDAIEIPWAIDGIIEQGGHTTIFGASESYKTFLALSMAASMASGTDWFGIPVKRQAVAYLVGEGQHGIMQRILAWESHHGVSLDDYGFHQCFLPAELTVDESAQAVGVACANIENLGAVFIDTMSRNFGPGNENSTQDMGRYISFLDQYVRIPNQAAIIHIHHTGLMDDSRGRGSSVLKAAMEAEFRMATLGDSVTFTCSKMKNKEHPPGMEFSVLPVELSKQDKKGNPIASVVLEYEGEPESKMGNTEGMGVNQMKARAILIGLYADHKKNLEGTDTQPRVRFDDWMGACKKEGMKRGQLQGVPEALANRKLIFRKAPYVYLKADECTVPDESV